jgi:RNA 2',3'-cyclic 3'-phosphodiesterase
MRCFTALELPDDVRAHLERAAAALKQRRELAEAVSWVKSCNVHVTLKFLGDIDDARVPDLTRALATLTVPEMTFKIDRFLIFPGSGPARVLACNLAGDTRPLVDLFHRLEPTVQPLGIRREGKDFKPHVTLGRFRRPNPKLTAMTLIRIVDPTLLPTPTFTAKSFTLFQSTLDPGGAIYTPLARFGETAE